MGFRAYFQAQATFADEAYDRGWRINCYMTAAAALDALAAIWESDFPAAAADLSREFGGKTPASVRMARLVRQFGSDPRSGLVSVVRFAEDAKPWATGAELADVDRLLADRTPRVRGELPPVHMDLTLTELEQAAPVLLARPRVRLLAEEYQYAALVYILYRCPTVHSLSYPKQTQGFAVDDEIFYMPLHEGFTSIGFGQKVLTNWLRAVIDEYVAHCSREAVRPAGRIDPGADQEARLTGKWKSVLA